MANDVPTLITDLLDITPDMPAERVRELNDQCLLALGWERDQEIMEGYSKPVVVWIAPHKDEIYANGNQPNLLTSVNDALAALQEGWAVKYLGQYWNDRGIGGAEVIGKWFCELTPWNSVVTNNDVDCEVACDNPATALTIANIKVSKYYDE